jgi:hypothetical protein
VEKGNAMENLTARKQKTEFPLADLLPTELEARLELQVFFNPVSTLTTAGNGGGGTVTDPNGG